MSRLQSAGRTESPATAAESLIFNGSNGSFLAPVDGFWNIDVDRKRMMFRISGFRKCFLGGAMSMQFLDLPVRLNMINNLRAGSDGFYKIRPASQPDFVRNLASCVLCVMLTNKLAVFQKGAQTLFVASQGLHLRR